MRRTSGPENFQLSAKKDFFNTIGAERTWRSSRCMSVIGATADDICRVRVIRLWTHNGSHGLLMARRCNVANIYVLRPKAGGRLSWWPLSWPEQIPDDRERRDQQHAPCAIRFPKRRCSFRRWITVMPVSPSAALPKCLLHRARFLPPQKIPEQLLLLASTERLRLG